jgi:anti-sigma B factor antagonist
VLDLREVEFMDSSGLHVLITQRHKRLNEGSDCTVAALPHPVRRVLEISGLADHFGLPADRSEASAAGA